jgi:hypothetical protein
MTVIFIPFQIGIPNSDKLSDRCTTTPTARLKPDMELETYEANLADIALQEQTFYETKPTAYELQMASQLMSTSQGGGSFCQSGAFQLAPIINTGGKGKKKKSVKFLTYVQVSPSIENFVGIVGQSKKSLIFQSSRFLGFFFALIRNALNKLLPPLSGRCPSSKKRGMIYGASV